MILEGSMGPSCLGSSGMTEAYLHDIPLDESFHDQVGKKVTLQGVLKSYKVDDADPSQGSEEKTMSLCIQITKVDGLSTSPKKDKSQDEEVEENLSKFIPQDDED